jgi:hypothetical protein
MPADARTAAPSLLIGHSGAVEIAFSVGARVATFRRSGMTGRAEIVVDNEVLPLQSPYKLGTHWSFKTARRWRCRVGEHDVEVAMNRPRMFGGARPKSFVVSVDGKVVAEHAGR